MQLPNPLSWSLGYCSPLCILTCLLYHDHIASVSFFHYSVVWSHSPPGLNPPSPERHRAAGVRASSTKWPAWEGSLLRSSETVLHRDTPGGQPGGSPGTATGSTGGSQCESRQHEISQTDQMTQKGSEKLDCCSHL